jgi:hypothetical protein
LAKKRVTMAAMRMTHPPTVRMVRSVEAGVHGGFKGVDAVVDVGQAGVDLFVGALKAADALFGGHDERS